jgi:hypothetical protein
MKTGTAREAVGATPAPDPLRIERVLRLLAPAPAGDRR